MTKVMAAHQPNFLPYLGFFDKMRAVTEIGTEPGVFIIRDDAQYVKREFHDRNKIRIYDGFKWLNVPVEKSMTPLKYIKVKTNGRIKNVPWNIYHLRMIEANYKKTPYFNEFYRFFKKIYLNPGDKLADFNMRIINYIIKCFGIEAEVILFSDLPESIKVDNASETLANAAREVGADIYLSGDGGKHYLDTSFFKNVEVRFQNYKHPVYPQRFSRFEPCMSAIDALFNIGYLPRSGEIVEKIETVISISQLKQKVKDDKMLCVGTDE